MVKRRKQARNYIDIVQKVIACLSCFYFYIGSSLIDLYTFLRSIQGLCCKNLSRTEYLDEKDILMQSIQQKGIKSKTNQPFSQLDFLIVYPFVCVLFEEALLSYFAIAVDFSQAISTSDRLL